MCLVCVLIHAQTAVLKTSAELYCSFSNTKLQNGDGGGPYDDYKKKQARNESCGSSFLFLSLKNLRFFICLSNVSLGRLTSLDLPRRNLFNDRDVSLVNRRMMFFQSVTYTYKTLKLSAQNFHGKRVQFPEERETLLFCVHQHGHHDVSRKGVIPIGLQKKLSLADGNLRTEIEGYASL